MAFLVKCTYHHAWGLSSSPAVPTCRRGNWMMEECYRCFLFSFSSSLPILLSLPPPLLSLVLILYQRTKMTAGSLMKLIRYWSPVITLRANKTRVGEKTQAWASRHQMWQLYLAPRSSISSGALLWCLFFFFFLFSYLPVKRWKEKCPLGAVELYRYKILLGKREYFLWKGAKLSVWHCHRHFLE